MTSEGRNAPGVAVGIEDAVPLLHALVARVAQDTGIRVLFIKGPILALQGLRPERPSVDVDVLVDPSRFEDAQALLRSYGWRIQVHSTGPHIMTFHSKAYRHDSWPCEIDVHDRFPGFLTDPQTAFEALWQRRTSATIAGHDIPCLDLHGNTAVAALHALRDPSYEKSRRDLAYMVDVLRSRLDASDLHVLAELAAATGAADTLRPFLDDLGAPRIGVGTTPVDDLRAWQLRTHASGVKTVQWVYQLRRSSMRARLPLLWHAFVLTEAEIRRAQPDAAPGAWGLLVARARRLTWGLKDFPRATRLVSRGLRGRLEVVEA